jgi:N-methylhydantoinase A/oxoprolinase/acetone carboxylase beta subunit
MSYRIGVDVGGTFTDVLLIDEKNSQTFTAKVPSTPADSSIAVLHGIARKSASARALIPATSPTSCTERQSPLMPS